MREIQITEGLKKDVINLVGSSKAGQLVQFVKTYNFTVAGMFP